MEKTQWYHIHIFFYRMYEHGFSHYSKSTRFPYLISKASDFVLQSSPYHERILENVEIINFMGLKRTWSNTVFRNNWKGWNKYDVGDHDKVTSQWSLLDSTYLKVPEKQNPPFSFFFKCKSFKYEHNLEPKNQSRYVEIKPCIQYKIFHLILPSHIHGEVFTTYIYGEI